MAERRMFAKSVVQSDAFLDLPLSAQALYFQIALSADDDGFTNSAKLMKRTTGASDNDIICLVESNFLIDFKNGVYAVRHWKINNAIRGDRYHPTRFQNERNCLCEIDKVYSLKDEILENPQQFPDGIPNGNQMATNGIPNGNQRHTEYSIGKDSIDKDSIGEERTGKERIDEVREEEERLGVRGKGNKATQFASLSPSSPSTDGITYNYLLGTLPSL